MTDDPQAARDALLLDLVAWYCDENEMEHSPEFEAAYATLRALAAPRPPQEGPAAAPDDEAEVQRWCDAIRETSRRWKIALSGNSVSIIARAALSRHRELTAGLREENERLARLNAELTDSLNQRNRALFAAHDRIRELEIRLAALEAQPREPTEEDIRAMREALDGIGEEVTEDWMKQRAALAYRVASQREKL